jgi:murein L,D-transpeptidase YafK
LELLFIQNDFSEGICVRKGILFVLILGWFMSVQSFPENKKSKKIFKKQKPVLTEELKKKGFEFGNPIFIRIFKAPAPGRLEVWMKKSGNSKGEYTLFKSYPICFYGGMGLGPKTKQGDGFAPEGFYFVRPNFFNPYSSYHLSFNLGYPNKYDRVHKRTGSALMVHGECVSIGCYAMTNEGIEEIYTLGQAALENGQKFFRAHVFPFPMTEENMKLYLEEFEIYREFWENLQEGYQWFEDKKIPPNVDVKQKRYVFSNGK